MHIGVRCQMLKAVASRRTPTLFEVLEGRRHLSLTVKLDYTYDTSGFFAPQQRRDVLQAAVNSVAGKITDHFAAITPSGNNHVTFTIVPPGGGQSKTVDLKDLAIPADTMVLYVGATALSGALAQASMSGVNPSGDAEWIKTVRARGRAGAEDGSVAVPTVSFISFLDNQGWYSSLDPSGLKASGGPDLYSIAIHEFGHALGIGISKAWNQKIVENPVAGRPFFTGANAVAAYGAPVPVENIAQGHLDNGVRIDGAGDLMTAFPAAIRSEFTRLDFAVLKDMGYTVPIPAAKAGLNGSITGYAYDDINRNGKHDAGEVGLTGAMYLDVNRSGYSEPGSGDIAVQIDQTGRYTVTGLPAGTYYLRSTLVDSTYTRVSPAGGDVVVTVGTDARTVAPDFIARLGAATTPSSISGLAFDDANRNGQFDSGDTVHAGLTVFLDKDKDNVQDASEPSVVTRGDGTFRFSNVPNGAYNLRAVAPDKTAFTTPLTTVTVGTRQGYAGYTFGIGPTGDPTAGGIVFIDADKDGFANPQERPLAGVKVYIDIDNDGVLDANEPSLLTGSGGDYRFDKIPTSNSAARVRIVVPAGYTQSGPADGGYALDLSPGAVNDYLYFGIYPSATPARGTIAGFAFDDADKDGMFDSGETLTGGKTVFLDADNDGVLDSGEKSVKTAADGSWRFTGLAAGTYRVRRVFPGGYTYSTTPIDVTLAAGQVVNGLAVGSKSGTTPPPVDPKTASVSGIAFNDANKNGKYDSGDSIAPGKTIWLDLDDDGVRDSNEPGIVTANDGSFVFKTLAAGKYHIRRVFSPGYAESSPAAYVTLATGQAATGVLIGSKPK